MSIETWVVFGAGVAAAGVALRAFVRREGVMQGHVGLLYRKGRFVRLLEPGEYWIRRSSSVARVDLRETVITIPSQELVTKDQVQLKVTAALRYSVVDPVKALHTVDSYAAALYLEVQLAVRSIVAAREVEDALAQRSTLDAQLLETVRPQAEALGLRVSSAAFKDFLLSGEIKKTLSDVVRARKEGQAALEKARGEVAALRALANAARVMEDHPALAQLRLVQSLGPGNTVMLGFAPGILPGRAAPPSSSVSSSSKEVES